MNTIEALFNGMSANWRKERSESQMTLAELIERLEQLPPDMAMHGLHEPHSYRGYYSDLAFEECESTTVGELIEIARASMGRCFVGYKGGDFWMAGDAPLWVAEYGCSGRKLMAINDDGTIETAEEK